MALRVVHFTAYRHDFDELVAGTTAEVQLEGQGKADVQDGWFRNA